MTTSHNLFQATPSTDKDRKLFKAIQDSNTHEALKLLKAGADTGAYQSKKVILQDDKKREALRITQDNDNILLFKILLSYGYRGINSGEGENPDPTSAEFFKAHSDYFDNKENFNKNLEEDLRYFYYTPPVKLTMNGK